MTMIERVARALCLTDGFDPDSTDSGVLIKGREGQRPNWEAFEIPARAAIEAMREPTEEMRDAITCGVMLALLNDTPAPEAAAHICGAMVDAALFCGEKG